MTRNMKFNNVMVIDTYLQYVETMLKLGWKYVECMLKVCWKVRWEYFESMLKVL